ncbi:MAG: CpsD/CapB family tyrosine-protein kinase [Vicinamibacterales bacterium]
MSRIDEALKRVAEAAAVEARGGVGAVVRSTRRPDEATLDHYPAERTPAFEVAAVPPRGERLRRSHSVRPVQPDQATDTLGPTDAAFEGKLVIGETAPPLCVEQYRRLAAAMHELQQERDLKTLMVTSALPREGKTLTVTNLALTLSNSYARRVLLIDADLRRPSVHEVLNLPNTTGLSEALRSDRVELPLRRVSPMLTVLTAGKADDNPMALLTSERMQRLLEESAARFDWVLLDAPPVGFMPDAGLLAGITRAILFVISAGSTPYQLVQRATAELGRDCIVGTVLNRIEDQNIPATGYYRDYYAGKSER